MTNEAMSETLASLPGVELKADYDGKAGQWRAYLLKSILFDGQRVHLPLATGSSADAAVANLYRLISELRGDARIVAGLGSPGIAEWHLVGGAWDRQPTSQATPQAEAGSSQTRFASPKIDEEDALFILRDFVDMRLGTGSPMTTVWYDFFSAASKAVPGYKEYVRINGVHPVEGLSTAAQAIRLMVEAGVLAGRIPPEAEIDRIMALARQATEDRPSPRM